jgi:hypothetical protein
MDTRGFIYPNDKLSFSIMSNDCPSFLEVGGYLFIFVISFGTLVYISLFWPLLALQVGLFGYIFVLVFILLLFYSSYKIYKSLFPECWL